MPWRYLLKNGTLSVVDVDSSFVPSGLGKVVPYSLLMLSCFPKYVHDIL